MDKNLKKALVYLLGLVLTFISGMIVLDKVNTAVEQDIEEIRVRYESTKETTQSSDSN